MMFLNFSSVPAFGLFSPHCATLCPKNVLGVLSLTCLTGSLCPALRLPYGVSFPTTVHDVLMPKLINKMVSASGTKFLRAIRGLKGCRVWRGSRLATILLGALPTTAVSSIFAFTDSATAMIEGSLSQRSLHLPTQQVFTKSATELERWSVAPFVSDATARMHPVLESTIAGNVPRSSSAPPWSARALSHCEVYGNDGPLVTFQRSESHVKCFDATLQIRKSRTALPVGDACFRELCVETLSVRQVPSWSFVPLGQLHYPSHVVVCPAMLVLPSVSVQSLLQYATPHLCFCAPHWRS